jgi:DNA-binding helix-hairpin-helix protein with protein kinase domain
MILMPKVIGYELHKLYSPAHRKQLFPKADWAFLVNTARNVAAAFDAIHAYGHVIGDVNQKNAIVASNSVVKLIDCDSLQIAASGKLYLCEVGVPDFTPQNCGA